MFASAAREVVFSNAEAVRRIQRDFIPVALKAAQVNNPPPGLEGRLYTEIGRSKPAPQGICVANSNGKALAWALSFDSDADIAGFLDHTAERYRQYPNADKPVPTQRYQMFPSRKLTDVADNGFRILLPQTHGEHSRCLGNPLLAPGILLGRIIGRALDEEGWPILPTLRQEHYMEARLKIRPQVQKMAVDAARAAGTNSFRLPATFSRALVAPAYLGQLDVNPVGPNPRLVDSRYDVVFFGQSVPSASGQRLHVVGESDVAGEGTPWSHSVALEWEGYIDIIGDQITQLAMLAKGKERLVWGDESLRRTTESASRHLMAGHAIDLDCRAVYGLLAEPMETAKLTPLQPSPLAVKPLNQQISSKVQRVQSAIQQHRQAGRDLKPVTGLMQQFSEQVRKQDFGKAEDTLDRALKILSVGTPASQKK